MDDLIDAFLKMMDSPDYLKGPVNIGNPGEYTMLELAETVLSIVGTKSKIVFQPLPADDPRQRQPDINQAKSELGWEPKVSLKDGLKETVGYFQKTLRAEV